MKLKITINILLIFFLCRVNSLKYQVKLSKDIPKNSEIDRDQSNPAIATLSNGNFVLVWDSKEPNYKVIAQIFDSSMNIVSSEIIVFDSIGSSEMMPFVVDLRSKNRMVFFWQDESSVRFKIYDYNGTPVTDEIKINTPNPAISIDKADIRAAATLAGNFFVTWQVKSTSTSEWNIRGMLFSSDGKSLTDDVQLSDLNGQIQTNPSVCTLKSDNFVVTYVHERQSGNYDVYFKIYDPNVKIVLKPETMVNGDNQKVDNINPHCAPLSNGGFVIAYVTTFWARSFDVAVKIYDKDGNALINEFRVNTVIANSYVNITPLGTGAFVVTYTSAKNVAYYQVYSSDGTIVVRETMASVSANNYYYKQSKPVASPFSDNGFILAFEYFYSNDATSRGINTNLYEATAGDCFNLQIYSGWVAVGQVFDQISIESQLMIKQGPKYGTLINSQGIEIDTVSLFPMKAIYYKPQLHNDDFFYYVIDEGEKPCRVDITMCYSSCQTCSDIGSSLSHNCDSCATSEGYFPLNDFHSQCYLKTEHIENYEFDQNANTFQCVSDEYCTKTTFIHDKSDTGQGTIIIIVIMVIIFVTALFAIIVICKRKCVSKPSQAIRTNQELEINPPTYSQEETGQKNSIKGDENIYQKL
jgi:hypothetical protein